MREMNTLPPLIWLMVRRLIEKRPGLRAELRRMLADPCAVCPFKNEAFLREMRGDAPGQARRPLPRRLRGPGDRA